MPEVVDAAETVVEFERIAALSDAAALDRVLGGVEHVRVEPATTNGSTEALHYRITVWLRSGQTRPLWLKINRLSTDWTARGSRDHVGREAAMLAQHEDKMVALMQEQNRALEAQQRLILNAQQVSLEAARLQLQANEQLDTI